jgi:tetratricopeptide (TPR) repeat protein
MSLIPIINSRLQRRSRSARSIAAVVVVAMLRCLTWPHIVAAGTPAESQLESSPAANDSVLRAQEFFQAGRTQYDLGNYEAAVRSFRRAYELAPAADLLFDIAQAHRMAGECAKALIAYRSFLRLSSTEGKKTLARGHELALASTCEIGVPTLGGAMTASRSGAVTAIPDPSSRGRLVARGAVIVGGLTAVSAGALLLWNQGRFSSWQQEDVRLNGGGATSSSDLERRQDANDALLRSIRRTDNMGLGLAIGGVTLVVIGAVANIVLLRRMRVARGTGSVSLAFFVD